ncbi:MAG: arsenate reductase (glutaredoxin) [Euryarchaeota archaeon]|nr:arsenate reductase (glutaredoxin) [Euryarchaeota archaeon]|tara:strand:+ start:85 stop:405 length:321 start_codon:yes stop_codon:yes gene_type:complete
MRLYHNPRCSKSRQAVALLEEKGVEFETYLYLKNGIDPSDIHILLTLDEIIRTSDLSKSDISALNSIEEKQKLLENNPEFLQRPVLITADRAAIGRPPEAILSILD